MKYPSRDRKRKTLVAILLLLIPSITLIVTERIPVSASDLPEIWVLNPLTGNSDFVFYTNLTSVGYRFNLTVRVKDVTDLFAYQVGLRVNDTMLNITRAWLPKTDPEWVFTGRFTIAPAPAFHDYDLDSVMDDVWVGDTIVVGNTFNGAGLLAIIELEILLAPSPEEGKVFSNLTIDSEETYLVDFDVYKITTTKTNGYYEYNYVVPNTQLEVKPREYLTQKLETFNVEVWLNKIEASQRLIGAQFWLHYNATLLNVLDVTEGSFLRQFQNAQTEPHTFFMSEIENQTVKVGILILPNATLEGGKWSKFPQGNGTLATITFQGVYQGPYPEESNCTLELTDVVLTTDIHISPLKLKEITTLPPINGFYEILPLSPSAISLTVDPTTIEFGSNVTLSGVIVRENLGGVISPTLEDVNVTIYKRLGTGEWTKLIIEETNSTGGYSYDWTPESAKTFEFKANWTGDETTLPAESAPTVLTVNKARSEISLEVDLQRVEVGSNVTISGAITPKRTNVNVTISYKLADGAEGTLATVETYSDGQYTYTWKTTQAGTYEIKASWTGDENTLPDESDLQTVNVEAPPSNVFLYILIAAIVIIAVALTLYYYYRRTRKSKQAPP